MSCAAKTISGFPFRIDVVFTGLPCGAGRRTAVRLDTAKIRPACASPMAATQDIFEAAGQQTWSGPMRRRQGTAFLPAGSLRASTIADDTRPYPLRSRYAWTLAAGHRRRRFHHRRGRNFTCAAIPKADALDLMLSALDGESSASLRRPHQENEIYSRVTHGSAFARLLGGQDGWHGTPSWRGDSGGGEIAPARWNPVERAHHQERWTRTATAASAAFPLY